jgi:hypothetical protein
MMKLDAIHIEEMRGIRKLDIDFQQGTFAISGPNGSGKSGVIDAIEFGLTGQIGRLTGKGTKGLSVQEHGPHVDKTKFPDAAFVELKLTLPALKKSVTIKRKVSDPKKPTITPADADVKAALAEVSDHPEIALSRREILRFILVEPAKRSEEIQSLLKLDEIGETRSALNTAQNRLQATERTAVAQVTSTREALQRHLQIATIRPEDLLEAVNTRRTLLGLPSITDLTADTKLDEGLTATATGSDFNKESALRDIKALFNAAKDFPELLKVEATAIVAGLEKLEGDPALLSALQRRAFIEKGLSFVDGPDCPLCDKPWEDEDHLRAHLQEKLAKSAEAKKLQDALIENASKIAASAIRVAGLLTPVQKLAQTHGEVEGAQLLAAWKADLDSFRSKLQTVDDIAGQKDRLASSWLAVPDKFSVALNTVREKIEAKPDQSATLAAQTFLTTAQIRLADFREALRKNKSAKIAAVAGKAAHDVYSEVMEEELNALYEEVQKDFSTFYKAINEDDEKTFTAKIKPTGAGVTFDVNFYDRGLFPPAAFHSEGHQDGMGVCLYLALMKQLFGKDFTFALLDDVVMSVDSGHRYQFCKLLKQYFKDTQFIITTHDRLWAEQMKSAGLITGKRSLVFHSWSIDGGPIVESNEGIWQEISAALGKNNVEAAAAALRHHLEYAARHLAGELVASVPFRSDGNYELGDLLPPVVSRMKKLLGSAAEAAQSWGNKEAKETATRRKEELSAAAVASNVEQWAVNKLVHYNEWANFGKKDFEPVVTAFKDLLACFRCDKCDSWLYITPRTNPELLICSCKGVGVNLKPKAK